VAFSDDKHWLATGSKDKSIRLWDLNDLVTPPIVLGSHEGSVNTIAISHDNRWLVSGSDDKTVQIWDLKGSSVTPIVLEPKSLYKN
jgi:WD40 repeat protein